MIRGVVSQALKGYSNCYPKGKSTFFNKSPLLDLSAQHVHLRFLEAQLTNLSSLQHEAATAPILVASHLAVSPLYSLHGSHCTIDYWWA